MESPLVQVNGLDFKLYIDQTTLQDRVQELGAAIRAKHPKEPPIFIGILNGAAIFMADLVRASQIPCELTFTRLSSYQGLASSGEVDILLPIKEDLTGRVVIVVEDIIDTGRTLSFFIPQLQALGPKRIEIATLLHKPAATQYPIPIDYLGFSIPNDFVIGYGLDFDGKGRELPAIYQKVD
ncbi:MAG: hypoxanthine phosphoribosyltransferase [Bacteroidota bacterium]